MSVPPISLERTLQVLSGEHIKSRSGNCFFFCIGDIELTQV
jgi:hypothetical protein